RPDVEVRGVRESHALRDRRPRAAAARGVDLPPDADRDGVPVRPMPLRRERACDALERRLPAEHPDPLDERPDRFRVGDLEPPCRPELVAMAHPALRDRGDDPETEEKVLRLTAEALAHGSEPELRLAA